MCRCGVEPLFTTEARVCTDDESQGGNVLTDLVRE